MATLGPATDPPGVLDRLVAAGVDCARLNCSHGTHDDLRRRAADVRAAAERSGRPLGLLFDLQGPKLRLSADTETRMLEAGEAVIFCGSGGSEPPDRVRVDFPHFAALVTERSQVVIGDGVPRLAVEGVANGEVVTRVRVAGAAVRAQGRQRHLRPPGAARDHREGPRRPGRSRRSWTRTSSRSRSSARPTTSSSCGRTWAR